MSGPAASVHAKEFDRVTMGERITDPDATNDERTWATLVHLGGFSGLIAGPLAIIVPLIIWLSKKNDSPFIDDHGKEAVNFQISIWIWVVASIALMFCGIGFILAPAIAILSWVYMIWYAVRANAGEYVRYPITIRFIQ